MKTKIIFFSLATLLVMSGCQKIVDVSIPNSLYEKKHLLTLATYAKPGGDPKDLYIEVMSGDSFLYFSKAKISEKVISGEESIVVSVYGSRTRNAEFSRSATGNFVFKAELRKEIGDRKIYYRDQLGLHPLQLSEWKADLERPYTAPPSIDPFTNFKG
jgi:hypothetical protein